MKKILIFIDSEPRVGGSFQYNQTILEAAMALPRDRYELVVVYTHRLWEKYLDRSIRGRFVPVGKLVRRALQLLVVAAPLGFARALGPAHPIARAFREENPDLSIFPSQESVWGYLTKTPSLYTIHDLMHRYERRFKEASGGGRYMHRERHFKNLCKRVEAVMVDSVLGKRHVCESYGLADDRVFVLPYIAPKYMFDPPPIEDVATKYSLPPRFIFYPAQFWPHKNHARLLRAVHQLRDELPDLHLVLVGGKKQGFAEIDAMRRDLRLTDIVHMVGFVPDHDLAAIYRRAAAMVMPTFFGPTNIPPLEALAAGCPIGASNNYGMPAQLGDAALYFDPESVDEIADVIKQLWTDCGRREILVARGRSRLAEWGAAQFNQQFATIVDEVISRRARV